MTTGIVTSELEAVLNVHLQGVNGRTDTLAAVLDTGFDGFITLPPDLLAEMGSPFAGTKRATLADGSETMFRIFDVTVYWQGQLLLVPALEVDTGALVGMALLHGSRLTIDVVENGPVRIEPIERKTNA